MSDGEVITGLSIRKICNAEHPMPVGDLGRWEHVDAEEIGECMDGCCAIYKCPNCDLEFREELPQ